MNYTHHHHNHHHHNEDASNSSREAINLEGQCERNVNTTRSDKNNQTSSNASATTSTNKTTTTIAPESSHKIYKTGNYNNYSKVNNNKTNKSYHADIAKNNTSSHSNSSSSISSNCSSDDDSSGSHSSSSNSFDSCSNSDTAGNANSLAATQEQRRRRRSQRQHLLSPEPNPITNEAQKSCLSVKHENENNNNKKETTVQTHLTCSNDEHKDCVRVQVDCDSTNINDNNMKKIDNINREYDDDNKDESHIEDNLNKSNNAMTMNREHFNLSYAISENEHMPCEKGIRRLDHASHEPSPSPSLPTQMMQPLIMEPFMESPSPCIYHDDDWHTTQHTNVLHVHNNNSVASNKKVGVIDTNNTNYNINKEEEEFMPTSQCVFTSPSIQMTAPSEQQQYTSSGTPLRFSNTSIITTTTTTSSSESSSSQEELELEEKEYEEKEHSHSHEQHSLEGHISGVVHLPRQSFSTSTSTSTSSTSSSSPELHSPSPMRALNAAFTLSPRAESETKDFEPLSVNWSSSGSRGNTSLSNESFARNSISGSANRECVESTITGANISTTSNNNILGKGNMMNLHDGYVLAIELDRFAEKKEKECNNDDNTSSEAIPTSKEEKEVELSGEKRNSSSITTDVDTNEKVPIVAYETRTIFINLSRLEERRTFVTTQCVEFARCMSNKNILESLLPALLTALECDDYGESFDNCSMCMLNSLPEVIKCMLPDTQEDSLDIKNCNNTNSINSNIDTESQKRSDSGSAAIKKENVNCSINKETTFDKKSMSYFVGLLLTLCCGAEHSIIEPAIHCFTRLMEYLPCSVLNEVIMPVLFALRSCFWATPRAIAAGTLGKLALTLCRRSLASTKETASHNSCTNCNSNKDISVYSRCGLESINTVSLADWVHVYEELAHDDICEVRTFAVIGLKDWIELFLHLLTTLSLPSTSASSSSTTRVNMSPINKANERYSCASDNVENSSCDKGNKDSLISEDVNNECTRYTMYKERQRAYKELLLQHIVPLVRLFICDDLSDTVRFTVLNEMHSMACVMGRTLSAKFLLPVVLSAVHDRSWRVRFTLANNMSGIILLLMTSSTLHKNNNSNCRNSISNNCSTKNDSSKDEVSSVMYTNSKDNNNNYNSKEEEYTKDESNKNKSNNSKSQINSSILDVNTKNCNSSNDIKGDVYNVSDKFVSPQSSKTVLGQILHTLSEDEECSVRAALASQLKSILAEVKIKYAHLSFIMESDITYKRNSNNVDHNNIKKENNKLSNEGNIESNTNCTESVIKSNKCNEKENEDKRSLLLEQSEANVIKGIHIAQICLPVALKLATDTDSHVRRDASSCLGLLLILLPCPVPSLFITHQVHPLTIVCNSITSLMKDRVLGVQLDALAGLKEMVELLVLTQENMHKGSKNSLSCNRYDEHIKGNTSSKRNTSTSIHSKETNDHNKTNSKSLENSNYGKAHGNAYNEAHKTEVASSSSSEYVTDSYTNKENSANSKGTSDTWNVQKLSEVCIMSREDFNKRMTIIHSTIIATLLDLGKSSSNSTYNSSGFKCNNSWHVRREVLTAIKYFCQLLNEEQFSPLISFISKCLVDAVHAVRCTALDSLGYVASFYGAEYAAQLLTNILLTSKANHHNSLISHTISDKNNNHGARNNKGGNKVKSASKENSSSTLSCKAESSSSSSSSLSLSLSSTHAITSSSFVWRVMDIRVLSILLPTVAQLHHKDLRRMHLMNLALELLTNYARDEVSNVRLALAECLKTFCRCFAPSARSVKRNDDENNNSCNSINGVDGLSSSKHMLEQNNFIKIIDILQNDVDNDVQATALKVERIGENNLLEFTSVDL